MATLFPPTQVDETVQVRFDGQRNEYIYGPPTFGQILVRATVAGIFFGMLAFAILSIAL